MSAHKKIRAEMIRNEREVRSYARRNGRITYTALAGAAWMKAIDRNVEKGLMKFDRRRGGYIVTTRG